MIPDMKWVQVRQNVFGRGNVLEVWKEKDDGRHQVTNYY